MTKKALEKLPEDIKTSLTLLQKIVRSHRAGGLHAPEMEYKMRIKGYLECLNDLGIITPGERRVLYIYFTA